MNTTNAEPKPVQTQEVTESFSGMSAKIDSDTGIVRDAVLFAPAKNGDVFISKNGNIYSSQFFQSAKDTLEGAMIFDGHADNPRRVSEAIGRSRNVRLVGDKVVGDLHFFRTKKDQFIDVVREAWDTIGLSIHGATLDQRDSNGRMVKLQFHPKASRRPSVDLVDAPGAAVNVFESAPEPTNNQPETTKETESMPAEITKEQLDEITKAITAQVMEAVKPTIESVKTEADKAKADAAAKERGVAIETSLNKHLSGDNAKFVTSALRMALEHCEMDKIETTVKEYADSVLAHVHPIKNMGQAKEDLETKESKKVEINVSKESLIDVIGKLADGKQGKERDQRVAERFTAEVAPLFMGEVDKQDQKKKEVRESLFRDFSLRELFIECTDKYPRAGQVKETAITSSSFTTITTAGLAAKMIDAYNSVGGLVGDQLVTPWNSTLLSETFPGFDEVSGIADVAEGATYPDVTIGEKYVGDTTFSKRGAKVLLTEETILFDQTQQILMRCNMIGEKLRLDREKMIINSIADNTNYRCYYPSGSQATLYDITNTVESNALVDYLNLQEASQKAGKQTDSNGERLMDNDLAPRVILVPKGLEWRAWDAINRTSTVLGTGSTSNVGFARQLAGGNPFAGTQVIVSTILDSISEATWYYTGNNGFRKQFIEKIHMPFNVTQLGDDEVNRVSADIIGGVRARYKSKVFALDKKYVIRNISSTLS